MRLILSLVVLLLLPVWAKAQTEYHYPTVRIHVPNQDMELAIKYGAAPDHGVRWIGDSLELPAFDVNLVALARSPLGYRQIEATPYHAELSARSDDNCTLPLRFAIETPQNFETGSMNRGYYSFTDTWDAFSEMRRLYPDLISERMAIDTFLTFEGREINYFRLSDNADTQENEPRIMLNALHHAREPMSLIQQVYFAWWLLENYGVDEEATWLIDNTELYLVPIVNPDGYAFNGAESGIDLGFWRKNRRPNGDTTFGVDLNRNYAYGFGGPGTSPDSSSDIYPGPGPLSEPETRALDFLHRQLAFTTILNAHSYSDLVIQPQLEEFTSETRAKTHQQLLWAMRRDNRYGVGDSPQTVGYVASGNSDDHFSLHQSPGKTLAISCTPEVGQRRFGFFPPEESIIPFAQDAVLMNWRALQSAHFTPVAEVKNDFLEPEGELLITVANISPIDGTTTLSIMSADPAITFDQDSYSISLTAGASTEIAIPYRILGTLPSEIQELSISFPTLGHVKPLTIEYLPVYKSEILFEQNMDTINSLFGATVIQTNSSLHPRAIQTSGNFTFTRYSIPNTLYSGIKAIRVSYAHRYAFASNHPNVSLNGGNSSIGYDAICTRQTSTNDPSSTPGYWGATPDFVYDSYVIPDVGEDGNYVVRWDLDRGFGANYSYELDDILIEALVAAGPVSSVKESLNNTIQVYPNPSTGVLTLVGLPSRTIINISNNLGQQISTTTVQNGQLDLGQLPKGSYLLSAVVKDRIETIRINLF
ncbi:MAG: M14 family zinc carboxypeptidase [Saprospiraceae bacterium]